MGVHDAIYHFPVILAGVLTEPVWLARRAPDSGRLRRTSPKAIRKIRLGRFTATDGSKCYGFLAVLQLGKNVKRHSLGETPSTLTTRAATRSAFSTTGPG